jgi:Tol biopolymer transport system component
MSLPAGTRLGPYEVLAPIGAGGMGEVYRARDSRLDRTVAIKVLPAAVVDHPSRLQRFEREARAVSRLSHPHICAIYDVGDQDGVHFIVMEYLDGETLAARIKGGPLPIAEALRLAGEVADALDHAHRQRIVHRDLKPANVMLTRSGAKLLDFGVARLQTSDETRALAESPTESLTQEGSVLGTLQYMAPEQLEGKEADARTDIFALGTVLYEMVTGRQPFASTSTASVIAAILDRDPPSMMAARGDSGERTRAVEPITPLLEHVVSRCLAKNPDERWQTAADLRQELKWIVKGTSEVRATPASAAPARSRRALLAWLALAAGLAIAAAAFIVPRLGWGRAQTLTAPTFTQLTFRRGNTSQARFAPDGQSIFYSAAWDGGPVQVYEWRPGNPRSRPLDLPSPAGIESVSILNELAVILGCRLEWGFCVGKLARVPLTGGAPRDVVEDVVSAEWTPDGKDLAVIHQTQGESRLEFPVGKTLYTAASSGKLHWIAFSPLGERLAFVEHPVIMDEAGDVKVVDRGGRVTTVSTGWRTIRGVRWSQDGTEILITGARTGKVCSVYALSMTGEFRVVVRIPGDMTLSDVARDGRLLLSVGPGGSRMIWASGGEERDLSWLDWPTVADVSSDGRKLLFYEWGLAVDANPAVFMRDTAGGDAVRLGDGTALALSPDGRWALALLETTSPELVLLATGTGQQQPLKIPDLSDVYWAKWFPNSRRILLVSIGADGVTRSSYYDMETGQKTTVADPGSLAHLVSPKGDRLLVRDPLAGFDIWPLAGGDPVPVPGILPDDRPIRWSEDGHIYLLTESEKSLQLYRYSEVTRRRERWRELSPRDPAGVVAIGSGRGDVAITADGKGIAFTYWVLLDNLFLVEGAR